ncbi:MAG: VWA domain-containing protein, partial [Rhodobacterales bacterium]
ASVTSQNYFMGLFSNRDFLQGPTSTKAAQGVSNIEVMLVLDITGSMNESIGGGKTKLQALKESAVSFVNIVEANDKKNGVSIGVVPYAAQVNIPVNLRNRFTFSNLSSWNGIANAGVPDINCLEFPVAGFTSTGVDLSVPIPMAVVGDSTSGTTTDGTYVNPQGRSNLPCTTIADNTSTAVDEPALNQVMLPTKNGEDVKQKINGLVANGNTYIAVGMRWATALIDQQARPIYSALLPTGDPLNDMTGRPVDNGSPSTRKIIILMTDGEHVTNTHVRDAFKSGLSPIWRGADGRYAIRFVNPSATELIRPGSGTGSLSCSGWQLTNYATREYFVPHLKRNTVRPNDGDDTEGNGSTANAAVPNACDPRAWVSTPSWSGSGTVTQLDWSEVWRYVRVSWVAQQLFVRSGVTGFTDYTTVFNSMSAPYLATAPGNTTRLDQLLQANCLAARTPVASGGAGIEIYGIMFDDAPSNRGIAAINGCSSLPKTTYYYEPKSSADLTAAFNQIATDISDLRLTQ